MSKYVALAYIAVIAILSVVTYVTYKFDKRRAQNDGRSEQAPRIGPAWLSPPGPV
jgi:uncharacterized membrane protein YsdA (DUF1294 family)